MNLTILNTPATILTEAKANETASGLNADAEDPATYKVEKKEHGYAVAVYEDDEFILHL